MKYYTSLISLMAVRTSTAFVVSQTPAAVSRTTSHSETILSMASSTGETEVEKLLRMARELRAQAEESENEQKEKLADKDADKKTKLGGLLNHLFYDGSKGHDVGKPETAINSNSVVVEKLRSKNPSVDTLEKFVDWMDDRYDIAMGYEHVESKGDGAYAYVKSKKDEPEAKRLFALTENLLDGLEVIDGEPDKSNGHLGGGNNAKDLRQRLRSKRRERDEQFLERQNSIKDAQTIKEGKSKYEFHDEFLDDREGTGR